MPSSPEQRRDMQELLIRLYTYTLVNQGLDNTTSPSHGLSPMGILLRPNKHDAQDIPGEETVQESGEE